MTLGFVILAHRDLYRVAQFVSHLSGQGCPVCVHVDANVPRKEFAEFSNSLAELSNVYLAKRRRCDWGRFSIVQATQNAVERLLIEHSDLSHVMLSSGSCLPVRPVRQLRRFLRNRPNTDFIESVSVRNAKWVTGGLSEERFTLYFPVSWRKRRRIFDRLVDFQRFLKVSRKIPEKLDPHLGSQWWCLTTKTLKAILKDPRRKYYDTYFSHSWIPDESYFQTLARKHSKSIESRSLTFSKFDFQGKPFNLYDDHLDLLSQTDCFFVRKVWPGAINLYETLLDPGREFVPMRGSNQRAFEEHFNQANDLRCEGRIGLFMQGRYPYVQSKGSGRTSAPYFVVIGMGKLFQNLPEWLSKKTDTAFHGNIYAPKAVFFQGGAKFTRGNLLAHHKIRDRDPEAYLSNLIWNYRKKKQGFFFDAVDVQRVVGTIVFDPNATVIIVRGGWVTQFVDQKGKAKLSLAEKFQAREQRIFSLFDDPDAKAKISVIDLDELVEHPSGVLKTVALQIDPTAQLTVTDIPHLKALDDLRKTIRKLRNQGMSLNYLVPPSNPRVTEDIEKHNKPYIVK